MSDTERPELQQTLSRLQRSYNLLNDAASIAHIGCFEWEIEADRGTWSREMYEILGLDPEQLGENIKAAVIFEMIHSDDLNRVRENHIRGLAENRSFPSEFRVIRPDKSVATLYASGKPVRLLGTLQEHYRAQAGRGESTPKRRALSAGDRCHSGADSLCRRSAMLPLRQSNVRGVDGTGALADLRKAHQGCSGRGCLR